MLAAGWRINGRIKGCKRNHLGSYYSGPGEKNSGVGKDCDGGKFRNGRTQEILWSWSTQATCFVSFCMIYSHQIIFDREQIFLEHLLC